MKKLVPFCLAAILCFTVLCASARGVNFARALSQPAGNTHLVEPTAVAANDGRVAVADEYDGDSKIYIFSDNGLTSVEISGKVKKMRISGNLLLILQPEKFIAYDLESKSSTEITEGSASVTSFDVKGTTTIYYTFGSSLRTIEIDTLLTEKKFNTNSLGAHYLVHETLDIAVTAAKIHAVVLDGSTERHLEINLDFESGINFSEAALNSGLTAAGSDILLWSKNTNSVSANGQNNSVLFKGEPLVIKDVTYDAFDGKVYILNNGEKSKSVYQYDYSQAGGFTSTGVVLGLSGKDYEIPFDGALSGKDDFRLAKVKGSRVYAYFPEKLNLQNNGFAAEDGFNGMLTQGQLMMTLGTSINGFYFVWQTNGKFSFVEETSLDFADAVLITEHEPPLLKATAGAGCRLYKLPQETNSLAQLILPKDAEVSVLADLSGDGFGGWHFVSVENDGGTVFGFMRGSALITPDNTPPRPALEQYKANPPVLQTLKVYKDADLNSEVLAEIESGGAVYVFKGEKGEKWAKIEIKINGENKAGFVLSAQLIESGLTNTFAAGLVTAIGVVLLMFLLTILNKRSKNYASKQAESPSLYPELERLD